MRSLQMRAVVSLSVAGLALGLALRMDAQELAVLPSAPSAIRAESAQPSSLGVSIRAMQAAGTGTTSAGTMGAPNFSGGLTVQQATQGALPLSLDDAVDRGVKNNLQMLLDQQKVRTVRGEILSVGNSLLPNMKASAYSNAMELNLAALGFKPASLEAFGLPADAVQTIVKVKTTEAQIGIDQELFNLRDYYLFRAAQKAADVAEMNVLNTRGGVVDEVATQYLAALSDQAQIANAQALEKADEEQLRQATLSHDAGVGTNLDVLRARVQLQTQQQALLKAQNSFDKDKIALNRLIGLPAGQELNLTDTVPYAEFGMMSIDQAKTVAYERRKDLLALEAQLEVATRARKAIKYERLPQLNFGGYYGVLGETGGLYHGVFVAQGLLKIPVFEEGRFRGEAAVTEAQVIALRHQIDSLKDTIEAQIRSSMLDVEAANELVKVARSNVELSKQELADTVDRFTSGVDDNLPVVQAQATLASAQSQLVNTEFQYNQSKLQLARNSGVVEIQYQQYLGRQ